MTLLNPRKRIAFSKLKIIQFFLFWEGLKKSGVFLTLDNSMTDLKVYQIRGCQPRMF